MFDKPINRWWTVLAGALGCAVGAGIISVYVLGVFTKDISAEFGWGRSFTTAGTTCFFIVSGLGSLALGSIMARRSVRSVSIVFVSLFALSIMSVAILPKSLLLFCIVFSLMGFFASAATAMPYAITIARQFDRNRGLALGLMVSGSGFGALLLPSYANMLRGEFGWRAGYLGIGALVGIISLGALILCFRNPPRDPRETPGDSLGLLEIYRSGKDFWLIGLPILFVSVALIGATSNLVPMLTDRGVSPAAAASIIGLSGAASWISRLGVGLLVDRMHAKYVAAAVFLVAALGNFLLATQTSDLGTLIAVLCIGVGIGAEADLLTFLASRYFSARSLARALGALGIFWAWGNGVGVFAGSLSFDLTGNYRFALWLFTGLALLSAACVLMLGKYRFPVHSTSREAEEPVRTAPLGNAA
jgi:predicted MFS family arabinose efflux permease